MDNARKSKRMFPAYTTKSLKARVAEIKALPEATGDQIRTMIAMEDEIAKRESGERPHFKTPQVDW